jgi:hypothetical protein
MANGCRALRLYWMDLEKVVSSDLANNLDP